MALCANCGFDNPEGSGFCGVCGAAIKAEHSVAGREERRVVSVLFVDLVGFTASSHNTDPEDVRAILRPYHALLKQVIERFGGTVEKFIGDAVVAVFGIPTVHEDDAERAVKAALTIVKAMQGKDGPHSTNIAVRAALNTGETLADLNARPELGEGMVTGDVINVASRLQSVAPVNGVVVGEMTYRSSKNRINYQDRDAVRLKGKPAPLPIWVAVSSKPSLHLHEAQRTPFVGRDAELLKIQRAYERAQERCRAELVMIMGAAGLGKSRLLAEFYSVISATGVTWHRGGCLPYGQRITFSALGEIIKAQAGISESNTADETASKLATAVSTLVEDASEQAWLVNRLAPLVGAATTHASERVDMEELFTAWRRFFEAMAVKRPLIVVFEDLHWADAALLEFIDHLVDEADTQLFVLTTARPEDRDGGPDPARTSNRLTISLTPLPDRAISHMLSSLLTDVALPTKVQSELLQKAAGNPLFAEEFVGMMRDRGLLDPPDGGLAIGRTNDIPMPESLQALIAARVDALPSECKSLLHDASVAGNVFWSNAVAAVGGTAVELVDGGLIELGTRELVRSSPTSSIEGQEEHSFWHALIRDVCYSQITRAGRVKKHRAMAAWIEANVDRVDDHAEVLAHHYSTALTLAAASGIGSDAAELRAQTSRFLVMAADRALKLDPAKALTLYRQALEIPGLDEAEMLRVFREAGTACEFLGMFSSAQSYFEQAIAGLSTRQDGRGEAIALTRLAHVMRDEGYAENGRSLTLRAVELLEQLAPGAELSRAYKDIAFFEFLADSLHDAITWANKAIEVARSSGASAALASALDIRGVTRCEAGDIGGLEDLREALSLDESIGDIEGAAGDYNNLADRVWLIDGPREALELNKKAQEMRRAHGYVSDARRAQIGALPMLFDLGMWDELFDQAEEISAWSQEHVAMLIGSWATFCTALILFHRGQHHEALSLEETFLPIFRSMDELEALAPSLALSALMNACSGHNAVALALVQEFERRTEHAPRYRARYLPDVLRALLVSGQGENASQLLLTKNDVTYARDQHAIVTAQALFDEATGETEGALKLFGDAAERWHQYGFVLEEGQAHLGAGRCLLTLGHKREASPSLQRAKTIFSQLGALPLFQETDSHLEQAT